MNQEFKDKIEELRKKYTSNYDLEVLKDLENKIRTNENWKKFSTNVITKIIIDDLKQRVIELRKVKAFSDKMSVEDIKVIDAKIAENIRLYSLLTPDVESALQSITEEMDYFLKP